MKIFNALGVEILDIVVDDNSYRYRAIMGEHAVTLYYSLPVHVEIPIGAYCDFQGERYTLKKPENIKKHHSRDFSYTLILDSVKSNAIQYKFRDTEGRLKFSLTATPRNHLQMFVDNMNRRESGWSIGSCIEAVEKTISYNHASCLDALTQQANEFETEYEFIGKVVSLRKVEYNKSNPLALSYGKGNGFKSGVGRVNDGDKFPINILFVQGGERNIDFSKYNSRELLLPKSQTFTYEGVDYITDAAGLSIRRNTPLTSFNEGSLDLSHIYPSRVGTVSTVEVVDEEKNLVDFTDIAIPDSLNFNELQIEGETLTIIFQSGILAGREFEIHKYVHEEDIEGVITPIRRFELVPTDIDGITMPNATFKPAVGDKYAVFGMMLPETYICDNVEKTGASWDMFREAAKYLYENEGNKFTFTGELDGIWSKKDWLNIGGKIKLGGYIDFSDTQFEPDGVLIRITGIKDYINNPYSPIIELSNSITGSTIKNEIGKIDSNEQETEEYHKQSIRFTKRRFRDAKETISMLQNALLNFSGSIDPITVRTMQLLVGDESLQFRFVDDKISPTPVIHVVSFDAETKVLNVDAGIIQHLTIGIDTISPTHDASDYKYWDLAQFVSPPLVELNKKYYLYARVSTSDQTGEFILSEQAISIDQSVGYYHLLVGVLNSEYDGSRSFATMYGFTEILPGRVTTDKIVSTDGKTYFDLVNSIIGGRIKFLSNGVETDLDGWSQGIISEISDIDDIVFDLDEYIENALLDDIISHAEAVAIQKYLNQINSEKAGVEATYNKLYVNPLLTGTPKTNLLNAKVSFFGSVDNLINAINTAIADGEVTQTEKQSIDTAFDAYSSARASFETRVEEANASIQQYLKSESDGAKSAAAAAEAAANAASQDVDDLTNYVDDLDEYVDGAFHDGVIEEAEAKAIEKYINQILSEKGSLEATYNKLYVNSFLSGTPKTNLLNAKVTFFGTVSNLIASINSVISDGKVTESEKQSVDAIFVTYRTDKAALSTRIEEANKAIQDYLKSNADAIDEKVNLAKAITDKFGATIDGGLISAVVMLLRELNSTSDTAGISGIQGSGKNLPAFWSGGTYAQAIANDAKTILRHDGGGQLAGGAIKWDADGDTEYSGTLKGVSGSFRRLNCVDEDGDIVGSIVFGSDGRIWFENCSIAHQSATGPFIASDIWVRGAFGSVEKTAIRILGSYGYVYAEGLSGSSEYLTFTPKTSAGGDTYYDIPLYSPTTQSSGCPIDIVIINHSYSSAMNYNLQYIPGKTVVVVNSNDDNNNVYVYCNGIRTQISGGVAATFVCVGSYQNPDNSSRLGRGWLISGKVDNDWT